MARHGKLDIFNSDQGSQFTGSALLATNGISEGLITWADRTRHT
jgi:hypothetical protein